MPAIVDENKCIGCQNCEWACPTGAISYFNDVAKIDLDKCIECGACASECPNDAITVEQS